MGKQEQYSYDISSGFVPVKLRAFQEDLDGLDVSQIQLSTDVSKLGEGTYNAVFAVNVSDGFSVMEEPTARIQIILKSQIPESSSEAISKDEADNTNDLISSSGSGSSAESETSEPTNPTETLPQESSSQSNSAEEKW